MTLAALLEHAPALFQRRGTGQGAEVMGHLLAPLVWHANMLAERGKALTAGMTVSTGSLSPPTPHSAGETATMAIGGLGEAHGTVLSAYTGAGRQGTLWRGTVR